MTALGVADDAVEDDVPEGGLAHEVVACHHHAGDPEEEDVRAGDEVGGGVVKGEVGGLLGPAEDGEGPEPGGEPGVEDVGVLVDGGAAALGADGGLLGGGPFVVAVAAGVDGDAVAPPDLPADAPVADVLHPVEEDALPALGLDGDLAGAHGLDGGLGEGLHADEPLLGEAAVHDGVAPVAVADLVLVGLDLDEVAALLQVGDDGLAAGEAIHPLVAGEGVHRAVVVHHVHLREVVPLAHGEVVGVVGGGDLDHTGAELLLHVVIEDDGDLAVRQRQEHLLAAEVGVARVGGVDGHGGVAGEGLGAGGGDGDELALAPHDGIADVPEGALVGLVLHLVVRQGRAASGAPIDDVVAAVDEALVVEVAEDLGDGGGEALVHGEALTPPVGGVAEHPLLVDDGAAVLPLPLPHAVDEGLPAEVLAALALLAQRLLDDILRGDARVVGAGDPAGVVAAHAVPTHKDVLDGLVQRVAHVEDAGDVGRRDHHGIGLAPARGVVMEAAMLLPPGIPLGLDGLRVVVLVHHGSILGESVRRAAAPKTGGRSLRTTVVQK